ncbi:MAG: hypothetical protein AAB250_01235, partial [Bdellovibrionota bacterium]
MVDQNRFEELCAGYVFGSLDETESNEFETALSDASAEQRQHFARARQTSLLMAASLNPLPPRAAVKDALMARIGGARPTTSSNEGSFFERFKASFNWMTAAPGFAAAALALVMWIQNGDLSSKLSEQNDLVAKLETQLGQQRDQIAQQETKVTEQAQQVAQLTEKSREDAELFAFLTTAQLEVASMQGL